MLNSKKILFILPDLALNAELLPDKKPYSFAIHSCTQINGSFIEDGELHTTNVGKLLAKLDQAEPYQIILPDDLFTNAIVTIKETGDAKVKEELKSTVLPSLGITQDTHNILTTVLNELRGTTRVQLTAIKNETLAPLQAAVAAAKVQVELIAPLSWSLKAIVSLEPSVVILQLGSQLYGSFHYIGVEQCFSAASGELEAVVAAVQKLKKAEPSIMTCYLVTNHLVESGLKEGLKQILPVQQMTDEGKQQQELPAAVVTIIEEAARTLSIADFPVPQFALGTASAADLEKYSAMMTSSNAVSPEPETQDVSKQPPSTAQSLPKPHLLPTRVAAAESVAGKEAAAPPTAASAKAVPPAEQPDETNDEPEQPQTKNDYVAPETVALVVGSNSKAKSPAKDELEVDGAPAVSAETGAAAVTLIGAAGRADDRPLKLPGDSIARSTPDTTAASHSIHENDKPSAAATVTAVTSTGLVTNSEPNPQDAIDLRQFAGAQSGQSSTTQAVKPKPIKNKSRSMTKMIIITVLVFLGTIAAGIGVGMLYLHYTSKSAPSTPVVEVKPTPVPTVEPTPEPVASESATATGSAKPAASPKASPSASPKASPTSSPKAAASPATSASPSATIAKQKILIVNATTKAGYAGKIKDALSGAGFKGVSTSNAKGKYTNPGDFVYQKKADDAALTAIEKASGLSFTADDTAKQEDPQGAYDVVIVLNQ